MNRKLAPGRKKKKDGNPDNIEDGRINGQSDTQVAKSVQNQIWKAKSRRVRAKYAKQEEVKSSLDPFIS